MGFDVFTSRCGCGAIVRLPNLKARASAVRCEGCTRHSGSVLRTSGDQGVLAKPRDILIGWKPLPEPNAQQLRPGQLRHSVQALFIFLAALCFLGARGRRSDRRLAAWSWRKRRARLQAPKHWSDCYKLSGAELRKALDSVRTTISDARRAAQDAGSGSLEEIRSAVEDVPGVQVLAIQEDTTTVSVNLVVRCDARMRAFVQAAVKRAVSVGVQVNVWRVENE